MSSKRNHASNKDPVEHYLKVSQFDPAARLPPATKPESAPQSRATTSPVSTRSKVTALSGEQHSRVCSTPNAGQQRRSGKSLAVLESIRSKVSFSRRNSNPTTLAQQQEKLRKPPVQPFGYDSDRANLIKGDVQDWQALNERQHQKAAEETRQQNEERRFFRAATRRSRVPTILDARNSRTISVYGLPGVDGNKVGTYRRVQLKHDNEESDRDLAVFSRPSCRVVPDEEHRTKPPIPSKSELRQAIFPLKTTSRSPPPPQLSTTPHRSSMMTSLDTEPKETSRDLAKQQQKVIHERLRRKGAAVPPYDFIELIGKGTYGRVYSAIDKKDGKLVAVKVMEADSTDYNDLQHHQRDMTLRDFRAEIGFLLALKEVHAPNINHIIDVFDVHDQLWIITEYCAGGSVRTLMQAADDKHLQEPYVIAITREMVKGLKAIHEAQIIHRDIKASNLMVTETGDVQIIDFGVASNLESHFDKRKTVIGTLHWMAPEMLKSVKDESLRVEYNKEIDIWSAGCTIYEMVTGLPPYARANGRNMAQMARQPPRLLASDEVSQDLCDFLEFVLQSKPENRPTATQMLAHPYLAGTEITQPTSILVDLVTGFKQWTTKGGFRQSLFNPQGAVVAALVPEASDTDSTHWRFSELPSAEELAKFHLQMNPITEVTTPTTSHLQYNLTNTVDPQKRQQILSSAEGNYHLKPTVYTPNSVQSTFVFPNQASPDGLRSPDSLSSQQGIMSSPENQGLLPEDTFVTGNEEFEEAAEKGGKMLGNIFRQSGVYEYGRKPSPPPSDLPLRTTTTNSNVHSKEVMAPDPLRPRLLAPGSVPDIGSVDVNTIKQNRQASRTSSATNSGDEGKDIISKPKRDTMAWEPDWNFSETPAAESEHPDPFASFDREFASSAAVASSSSGLAPPQRPGLHQANSAPGVIPTVADSRASVGSSLDLDALMGDDFAMPVFPGQGQSTAFSDPTYSPVGLESGTPHSDPLHPIEAQELISPGHTDYPPFENGQYPGSPDDLDSPIPLPLNITPPRRNTGGPENPVLPPYSDRPLGPITPPNPAFLAGTGDDNLTIHEVTYYLRESLDELVALDQDMHASMARQEIQYALERAAGDYDDDYEDEGIHEEAYEGEYEGEHDGEGDH